MAATYWVGSSSGDFFDASNWSAGEVPESLSCNGVAIEGSPEKPVTVVANAPTYTQVRCITVGDNATLKITAENPQGDQGAVFSTQTFQVFGSGNLIIDTPDLVDLGSINEMAGALTIVNNANNVLLDNDRLTGNGTLNLIHSTLGSAVAPIRIDNAMNVTLQGGSTLYAGFYASGGHVTFDPGTINTLVLTGQENTIQTAFSGVSDKTVFAINPDDGEQPKAATYQANGNGAYSLIVQMTDGKTVTLSDIRFASDFTPGLLTIGHDAAGDYTLVAANAGTSNVGAALHDQLAQFAASIAPIGGNLDQYSTQPYSNHNASASNWFAGAGTATKPAHWSDPSNWALGHLPQDETCEQATLVGSASQPLNVIYDTANPAQITCLEVGNEATLTITAPQINDPRSYVFATQGVEILGNGVLTIDTPAPVELGGVNEIAGTLTIRNNDGNVMIEGERLVGSGTLNLDHATLGTAANPISINLQTVNMSNDAVLYAGFEAVGNIVNLDESANLIVLGGLENVVTTRFNNVSANTQFAVDMIPGVSPLLAAYTANGDGSYTLTIEMSNGSSLKLPDVYLASDFQPTISTNVQDPPGVWTMSFIQNDACFMAGTLIRTEHGDVAVEDLRAGDRVVVLGVGQALCPVRWTGYRDVRVTPGLPDDAAGYIVRVMANAIAPGVPARDLYVTSEHCLFLDGGFVPVRMLINGTSIAYERGMTAYRYYHVELEEHGVILAENCPTESYLDTGNRRRFSSAGNLASLENRELDWHHAAAPLHVARSIVEPLHGRLAARAAQLGHEIYQSPVTTMDPDLRFLDQAGRTIPVLRRRGAHVLLMISSGVTSVRIVSRTARPCDAIGPFVDDRRVLGVLIGNITSWAAGETRRMHSHLSSSSGRGWHTLENADMRWTQGDALLDFSRQRQSASFVLSVQVLGGGPYLLAGDDMQVMLAG